MTHNLKFGIFKTYFGFILFFYNTQKVLEDQIDELEELNKQLEAENSAGPVDPNTKKPIKKVNNY